MLTETVSQQESTEPDSAELAEAPAETGWRRKFKKYGTLLLIFYTVKGLLWLIVPALIAWWGAGNWWSLSH